LAFAAASVRTAGLVLSKQGAAVSSDVNGFLKAVKEA
jgi:hypothetical protein